MTIRRRDPPVRLGDNSTLDDVRIYNRALSPAEVQQLYQLGQVIIRP